MTKDEAENSSKQLTDGYPQPVTRSEIDRNWIDRRRCDLFEGPDAHSNWEDQGVTHEPLSA